MFNCSECGYKSIKWLGKCPLCGSWEAFVEEVEQKSSKKRIGEKRPLQLLRDIGRKQSKRISTGLDEFDRILGGGVVEGEIILIGGAPGVGKSTLLLEVSSRLTSKGKVLYVSAEESPQQIGLRAQRLGKSVTSMFTICVFNDVGRNFGNS